MARNSYYNNNYTPHFFIDGNIDGEYFSNNWNALIANEMEAASPLEIIISGAYDPVTRDGDLEITVTATDRISYSNLKLRIAITESNI